MLGTIFHLVGIMGVVAGLVQRDGVGAGVGLVTALCGTLALVATIKTATWIELDPEGFSVREGRRQERIHWDELTEVKLKPSGKSVSLQVDWRPAGRETIRTLNVSAGLYQTSHVESTLKWYWHHPERRFKLKRA
jgi:hypothetical protein